MNIDELIERLHTELLTLDPSTDTYAAVWKMYEEALNLKLRIEAAESEQALAYEKLHEKRHLDLKSWVPVIAAGISSLGGIAAIKACGRKEEDEIIPKNQFAIVQKMIGK